jgi:hypothetical protein
MSKVRKYDFNALLAIADREDAIRGCNLDMWGATVRVCPKWRGRWPGGNVLIEWLYNERPEIARKIERKYKLYPEGTDFDLLWPEDDSQIGTTGGV